MADHDLDEMMVDILDRGGRLRRFFVALAVGVAVAIGVGLAVARYVNADHETNPYRTPSTWRTVFYVAGLSGAGAAVLTATLLAWLKRRRDRANVLPRARIRR